MTCTKAKNYHNSLVDRSKTFSSPFLKTFFQNTRYLLSHLDKFKWNLIFILFCKKISKSAYCENELYCVKKTTKKCYYSSSSKCWHLCCIISSCCIFSACYATVAILIVFFMSSKKVRINVQFEFQKSTRPETVDWLLTWLQLGNLSNLKKSN